MSSLAFEFRHVIGFEETNLVGNVYYANHLKWQGRCREMFLRQHCSDTMELLHGGLALITTRCSCDYFAELNAFDEVLIRMRLREISQNRVTMAFDYFKVKAEGEELAARGEQQIACMQRQSDGTTVPTPVPESLRRALEPYGSR